MTPAPISVERLRELLAKASEWRCTGDVLRCTDGNGCECGARNATEVETMCHPSGDSCPGSEWPLSNIWDLTARPTPEADARDAARYRWLRNNSVGQLEHPIVVSQRRAAFDTMQYIGPLAGTSLDTAIDAALALPAQGEGENG